MKALIKIIFSSLIIFLFGCGEPSQTEVTIKKDPEMTKVSYQGKKFEIKINVYEPPINLTHSDLTEEAIAKTDWLRAYQAFYKLDSFTDYNDWISYFSNSYKTRFGLNEALFNEVKADPSKHISNPEKSVIIYSYEFVLDGKSYLCIVQSVNIHLSKVPNELGILKNFVEGIFMEKKNGKWVFSTIQYEYEWLDYFQSNSINLVKDKIEKIKIVE